MIKGLVGSGPPLGLIAPESRDLETEIRDPKEFQQALKAEEPDEEKSDPSSEKPLDGKKSVDLKVKTQRERAIRKFMDSIEGDFGIPPAKMVDAMAQLPAQDMELTPQKTVNQVIDKLGLEPQQAVQVKQLYKGLLQQLQQIETRAQLPSASDAWLSQLSMERQLGAKAQKALQGESIQKLNQNFWVQPDRGEGVPLNTHEVLPRAEMENALKLMESPINFEALDKLSPDDRLKTLQDLLQTVQEQVPEQVINPQEIQVKEWKPESLAIPFVPPQPAVSGIVKPHILQPEMQNEEEVISVESSVPLKAKEAENFELSMMKRMLGISETSEKPEHKPDSGLSEMEMSSQALQGTDFVKSEKFDLSSLMAQPVPASSASPSMAQKTENMQNLMNQAQILVQKGGGEMKIEMSPEGMGSVQMKLKVLDGKVQLQMAADNKEVKKLIENSIQDLKTSLASHNLAVDQVRVDVVNQSMGSSDVRQDLQGQMNQFLNQQQRDGTRQFWQQFNENFGNRQARENLYDAQNIRRGPTEQALPGFSSSAPRTSINGRGQSLNLVA
ncbi:MAG: flagellar hook-length control protein FliK [Bdellovibrionales bacterium]